MLVSRRRFTWSDVHVERTIVRQPSLLVKVVGTRGVITEDFVWERARSWSVVPDWPCVGVPVRGHGIMRAGEHVMPMQRGWLGFVRHGAKFRARTEAADAFGVFMQWDPSVFGAPPGGEEMMRDAIGSAEIDLFARVASSISSPETGHDRVAANVAELIRLFSSRGFFGAQALDAIEPSLVAPPPAPRIDRIGQAIDAALSRPGSRPMVVDLSAALGCSERQARYLVREYAGAYALQGVREWRTLVGTWTTYLAGLLVTARDASTEGIARILGYGSPNAFCHALGNAGLPPPGELRRYVVGLA